MEVEYEATFPNIDKEYIRKKLKEAGAVLIRPEFLQKRIVFNLPKGHEIKGGWLRVRDEEGKTTMTLKVIDGERITSQKEICLSVDSFKKTREFLKSIGCLERAYQENKREIWKLEGAEITIDEWPFLEPFIEIEGKSEVGVISTAKRLGLNYNNALFCSVDVLYAKKYNISEDVVNNQTPKIIFEGENPFLNKH